MPIRFRCAYCNQLLGISRRKAGTVVRCPTCAGQVVVPNVVTESPERAENQADPFVFERSDFEELLTPADEHAVPLEKKEVVLTPSEAPVAMPSATADPPPGAWGTHAEPAYAGQKIKTAAAPLAAAQPVSAAGGILLSPARATLLVVVAIVALALAFAAGLFVGWRIGGA